MQTFVHSLALLVALIVALSIQPAIQQDTIKVKIPLYIVSFNHQADLHAHDNTGMNHWVNPKLFLAHLTHPQWTVNDCVPARYGDPKASLRLQSNFGFPWGMEDEGEAALEFLRGLGEARLCIGVEVRDFMVEKPLTFRASCWEDSPYPGNPSYGGGYRGYWNLILPSGQYGDTCFIFKIDVDYSNVRVMKNRTDIQAYVTSHVFQLWILYYNRSSWREPMPYQGSFHLVTVWIEDEVPSGMLPLVEEFTCGGWDAVAELRDRPYNPYVVIPDEPEHSVEVVVNEDSMDRQYAYWAFIENDGRVNVTWLRNHDAVRVWNHPGPRPFMLKLLNHSEGWTSHQAWWQAWTWSREQYNVTVVLGGSLGNPGAREWEARAGVEWRLNHYTHELTLRLPGGRTFKSSLEMSGVGAEGIALFMCFLDDTGRLVVLVEGDTRWGTKALADYLLELESQVGVDNAYNGVPTPLGHPVALEYRGLLPYILVIGYRDVDGDGEYCLGEVSVLWEYVGGD